MAGRGRPKGSKNKITEKTQVTKPTTKTKEETNIVTTKQEVGKVSLPQVVMNRVEVQRSPLHVSASVGACFKTGRVGITSLSIQVEYEGDITKAVDDVAQICNDEWERLQRQGLTQIVPDTYYEGLQNKKTKPAASKPKASKVVDPIEEEFDDTQFDDVDTNTQALDTVKEGEAALDEIEKTEKENAASEFDADSPVETPSANDIGDEFDALAEEFEDDTPGMEATDDVAPNITEEVVEPEFNDHGEPLEESEKLDPSEKLGFDGADEEEFDIPMQDVEEKLEENNGKMICVFDLSPEQQIEELTKRGVTEIEGVPLADADEPDIVMALDALLEKEAE